MVRDYSMMQYMNGRKRLFQYVHRATSMNLRIGLRLMVKRIGSWQVPVDFIPMKQKKIPPRYTTQSEHCPKALFTN
ncbi:MAG: hypothetical protein DME65_15220 [Verrucomicrobia bacterium]|nr:MAG: hypothetical protein DME65_15220 [Verrucomicrobiota bacterium]